MPWRSRLYAPPLRRLRAGILIAPVIVAAIWAHQLWQEKRGAAIVEASQSAALVSEYVLRIFQSQKLLLDQVDRIVTEYPAIEPQQLHQRLRALDESYQYITSLGVIDADGRIKAGSRNFPLEASVEGRDYFKALRDADLPLFVDRITLQPTGRDTITLAHRLPGDGFRGLATASTDVVQFTDFLAGVSQATDAAAFLMRSDGKLLVRPNPSDPAFMMLPDGPVMTAVSKGSAGIFEAPGRMDGVSRIYAFRKIGDLPLYAIYGRSQRALFVAVMTDMVPIALFLILSAGLGYLALSEAIRRIEAERARREAEFDRRHLDEARQMAALKETLLKEMNHRVHNNLQTIQALIHLRSRNPVDPTVMLQEIAQRVWAISEVHSLLYNSAEYSHLDLGAFLRTMANNPGIVPPEQAIAVECHTEKVEVELRQAVPASLIVLESLTNALKHAFPGERSGTIRITLRRREGDAEVVVADDGVGMPDIGRRNSGMKLNRGLAAQIQGSLEVESGGNRGTRITLRFPIAPAADGQDASDAGGRQTGRPQAPRAANSQ